MKEIWQDKNKRKGLLTTVVVHLALLLLFLFVGLSYYEPKPEDGILINFGNSATGLGQEASGAPVSQVQTKQPAAADAQPETSTPSPSNENTVATQNVVEAPSLATNEKPKNQTEKKKPTPKPTETTKEPAKEKPDPQPSNELQKLLQSTQNAKSGGEGVKKGAGDQGDPDGDKNSPNRTGSGGGGAGGQGNYRLGGRQALQKPTPDYPCSDQGRVVVKIYVNQSGQVTRAVPGERVPGGSATTTTSSCLYSQAKAAALKTTWQAKADAPDLQIGYIIYNFKKQ
jgi:outer membrane biosynthesis protein TonB